MIPRDFKLDRLQKNYYYYYYFCPPAQSHRHEN